MVETGALDRIEFVMDSMEPDGARWASIRHYYALRGERGAVSYVYLDWGPNATDEMRAIDTEFMIKFGHPLYPMAADLCQHSSIPQHEWHVEHGPIEGCLVLDGPCYADGSTIAAKAVYRLWVAADRDDEVIWAQLHAFYLESFHDEED